MPVRPLDPLRHDLTTPRQHGRVWCQSSEDVPPNPIVCDGVVSHGIKAASATPLGIEWNAMQPCFGS